MSQRITPPRVGSGSPAQRQMIRPGPLARTLPGRPSVKPVAASPKAKHSPAAAAAATTPGAAAAAAAPFLLAVQQQQLKQQQQQQYVPSPVTRKAASPAFTAPKAVASALNKLPSPPPPKPQPRQTTFFYETRVRTVAETQYRCGGKPLPPSLTRVTSHWVDMPALPEEGGISPFVKVKPFQVLSASKADASADSPTAGAAAAAAAAAGGEEKAAPQREAYLLFFQSMAAPSAARRHPTSYIGLLSKLDGMLFGGEVPPGAEGVSFAMRAQAFLTKLLLEKTGLDLSAVTTWYSFLELHFSDRPSVLLLYPAVWETTTPLRVHSGCSQLVTVAALQASCARSIEALRRAPGTAKGDEINVDDEAEPSPPPAAAAPANLHPLLEFPFLITDAVEEYCLRYASVVVRSFLRSCSDAINEVNREKHERSRRVAAARAAREGQLAALKEELIAAESKAAKERADASEGLTAEEADEAHAAWVAGSRALTAAFAEREQTMRADWAKQDEEESKSELESDSVAKTLVQAPLPAEIVHSFSYFDLSCKGSIETSAIRTALLCSSNELTTHAASTLCANLHTPTFSYLHLKLLSVGTPQPQKRPRDDGEESQPQAKKQA
ncbi:hypothetical protein DIPPA_16747 [Diplonema papillatum]|nr:hypothetical protein DIPPA_16747 [Diplonema papillatum]